MFEEPESERYLPPQAFQLEVRGYAQELSVPGANDRLSALRALSVANELQRWGVPQEFITSVGFGMEDPFVRGEPLNPQNRRAWIMFRP